MWELRVGVPSLVDERMPPTRGSHQNQRRCCDGDGSGQGPRMPASAETSEISAARLGRRSARVNPGTHEGFTTRTHAPVVRRLRSSRSHRRSLLVAAATLAPWR
jgi:hypothetical protein